MIIINNNIIIPAQKPYQCKDQKPNPLPRCQRLDH